MTEHIETDVPERYVVDLKELTVLLVKHFQHKSGIYDLAFNVEVGLGAVGPNPDKLLPGAMFGIAAVGIQKVDEETKTSVDASKVNPD